jgi:fatty acid desaturase
MDHKSFLKSLPADTKAVLTETSDRAGILHLALHVGLIIVVGTAIALQPPYWPLLLPVQGVLLIFLFTLEHECTHRTPFRARLLNDWVGRICGLVIVLPFEWFRYFHLAHHRFTNIPGQDPELATDKPETRAAFVLHIAGLHIWASNVQLIWRLARRKETAPYLPPNALARMEREARILCALYALAAVSLTLSPLLLWVWIVPVLLGQPALRIYLLAEHGDCPNVINMFENTRTTFTTVIIRFLAWNMPYHTEHHVFPAVPFHRLPDLHRIMRSELRVTADGYAEFTRDYLSRR